MGFLYPACYRTTFSFSFTSNSGSRRWHIMEYLTDFESLYRFSCHLSCIHYQSGYSTVSAALLLFRGPFDISHCPSIILILNLHLIIPLLSKMCFEPITVLCSHFSPEQWAASKMRQRIGGNKTRGRETHWTKDEMMRKKEWDRAEERAGRKENWDMRLFDLKGSIRGIKAGRRLRNSKKWEERCF